MDPETPAPPPEARLIRAAREAIGISAAKAAEATSGVVSPVYWRDVERGSGGRRGERVRVRGSDRVIAHMARAVGLTPERLETKGERPDAAGILREILREVSPAPAALRPVAAPDDAGADDQYERDIVRMLDDHPDDRVIRAMAAQSRRLRPARDIAEEIRARLERERRRQEGADRNGTTG